MKAVWKRFSTRLERMSLRERALLLVVSIAVVVLLADTLYIEPPRKSLNISQGRLAQAQAALATAADQERALVLAVAEDPDRELRERIVVLRGAVARSGDELALAMARFISPTDMTEVLRALVTRTGGLSLESLRSLPSTVVSLAEDDLAKSENEAGRSSVYRRAVEIELSGGYAAMLEYVRAIEALPWALGWDLLLIDASGYPVSRFVLRLHTLSLEEGWIGV